MMLRLLGVLPSLSLYSSSNNNYYFFSICLSSNAILSEYLSYLYPLILTRFSCLYRSKYSFAALTLTVKNLIHWVSCFMLLWVRWYLRRSLFLTSCKVSVLRAREWMKVDTGHVRKTLYWRYLSISGTL